MEEMEKHGSQGLAALKSGMHRHTAAKYLNSGKVPSELKTLRAYRTREDRFAEDWESTLLPMLEAAPELEAKALFEWLCEREPERYEEGQLRTLQRKVRRWRAESGPPKEVFFPQEHVPGEAMQTDFTHGDELGVTIEGQAFSRLLCHPVLPYSNWEWVTVCRSESIAAIRRGVQEAVFKLGRVPKWHQTDNSSAATHSLSTGKRGFNDEYAALIRHLGMKPRTTGVGKKEQNGDVEAANGALKRRLKQHLLLRGSRDFESVGAYEAWVQSMVEKANGLRRRRLADELSEMNQLRVSKLPEFSEVETRVSKASTVRVKRNIYSVPSRLIGEVVKARVYDDRIEVYFAGTLQLRCERLAGKSEPRIDYRHVIWSLARKPGAFQRYRYRDAMYPSLVFRRAYDVLHGALSARAADIEYLRLLLLAASTMEADVEAALLLSLEVEMTPSADAIKAIIGEDAPEVPKMPPPSVDLREYDALLQHVQEVAS